MSTHGIDRAIRLEVDVEAGVKEVWEAWTTKEGLESFFGPVCRVELRVDGAYEILFNPDGEPGYRGAEGMRVMAYQPEKMLAFTWNAPPHLPEARKQLTHVQVWMETLEEGRTRVTLAHRGWGEGGEWDEAFDYFVKAWGEVVLPRLQYRFSTGPVDWENLPQFGGE
jgi:uncharacterized protein YndB with AHSA1/START domain